MEVEGSVMLLVLVLFLVFFFYRVNFGFVLLSGYDLLFVDFYNEMIVICIVFGSCR